MTPFAMGAFRLASWESDLGSLPSLDVDVDVDVDVFLILAII
jgi:hypothetical protein